MGTFTQTFDSDTVFTYDSDLVEFVSGTVQQIDQRSVNYIVGSKFNPSLNANWGVDGFSNLAPTIFGSPVINNNRLECFGGHGVCYQDTLIGNLSGNFVIKLKYTPNYTLSPATNVNIVAISQTTGITDNIVIFNSPSGNNLRITANGLSAVVFDSWSPVAGQSYIFEVHCVNNAVSIYVDNTQIGTAKTISPVQGTDSTFIHVGAYSAVYAVADGSFEDLILYSSAPQTDTYVVPENIYLETPVILPDFVSDVDIIKFTSFETVEVNSPRYIQNGNYWGGSQWIASNGSYAQSSSENDTNTNIETLTANNNLETKVVFGDSAVKMAISSLTINFLDKPKRISIEGVQYRQNGVADMRPITVKLNKSGGEYEDTDQINQYGQVIEPDINGVWSVELVDTENIGSGYYYSFFFNGEEIKKTVPSATTPISFNSLPDYTG